MIPLPNEIKEALMQNILTNFKRMNLFQKNRLLSGIIPLLSAFLVSITGNYLLVSYIQLKKP